MGSVKRKITGVPGSVPPKSGMEYRCVYVGVRLTVWWDTMRAQHFVVGNAYSKLLLRLGVQEQRAQVAAASGQRSSVSAACHRNDLAGELTTKYMYEVRQAFADHEVAQSCGGGYYILGPRRRVRVCHGAWNCEADPPDRDFNLLTRELHKCKPVGGHWDERRLLKVRHSMTGRRVIVLGVRARLTSVERRAIGCGHDVRPGEVHSGKMIRHEPGASSESGGEPKGAAESPHSSRRRRRRRQVGPSDGTNQSRSTADGRGRPRSLPPRVGNVPPSD